MSEYIVHHLNDDGTDGAVIGTASSVEEARELGDEQAADPDYPWYRIYRDGKHVETAQAYPADYYDPERAGISPVPTPEQRAAWPAASRPQLPEGATGGYEGSRPAAVGETRKHSYRKRQGYSEAASGGVLDAGAGVPLVGRQGPVNAPSMRATRSARACRSRRNSPSSATTRPCRVRISGTSTASRATPTPTMAIASALTVLPSSPDAAASSSESVSVDPKGRQDRRSSEVAGRRRGSRQSTSPRHYRKWWSPEAWCRAPGVPFRRSPGPAQRTLDARDALRQTGRGASLPVRCGYRLELLPNAERSERFWHRATGQSVSLRNTVKVDVQIKHSGLQALHERGDRSRLSADLVPRLRRILLRLEGATRPGNMGVPGYHLHPLKGARRGQWSVRVSGNWRVVFRFEGTEAVDVDLIDYH